MRLIVFLFLVISMSCYGQFSIDLGARKQFAKFWANDLYEGFIPSYSNRYINDSYFVKLNKERKQWIWSAELSYLPKSLDIDTSHSSSDYDYYYGMGPPGESGLITETETVDWTYQSKLRIDYVGLRLSADRKFLKGKFNILLGTGLNADIRIRAKESSSFEGLKVKTRTDWNGTTVDSTILQSPYNNASSSVNLIYFTGGLNSGFRYNFEKMYVDLFVNHLFTWYGRYRNTSTDLFPMYEEMHLGKINYNLEYGFRLGFYLKNEEK